MHKITTADNLTHFLPGIEPADVEAYDSSPNGQAAIQAAIAANSYEILPTPSESNPEPDWDGFNAEILANAEFNSAYLQVVTAAPIITNGLAAALTQVATGQMQMFRLLFTNFCAVAEVSAEQRGIWADIAATYNLPPEFVVILRSDDG